MAADSAGSAAPQTTRRELAALLAILAVAFGLRLLHFFEIERNDPFFTLPAVDGQLYHAQALALSEGRGLDTPVLILGPAYPFFMAALYWLVGPSLYALKVVQVVIGTLDCLLVWWLGRLCFDRATSLVAAAVTAVYGMLIFYGGTVMIVNLMVPAVLGSAIAVTLALRRPTFLRWALAGLVVSFAILARQTMLLFVFPVVPWLFWALRERASLARRTALAAVFGAAVLLPILPFTIRNYVVGGERVLLNSTGGIAIYMGNSEWADGTWVPPDLGMRVDSPIAMQRAFTAVAERETGRKLKTTEVSAFWTRRAIETITSDPRRWLALEWRKFVLFWNAREVWNNHSIDIARDFSWVLRLPLVTFGAIAPFALVGLALTLGRWRELFALHAVIAVYFGTALIFAVLSRYRIPTVPVLFLFAAYAVTRAVAWARERRFAPLAAAVAACAALFAFVHVDMGEENLYMAHYNAGNKYLALERWDEAITSFRKSLALNPTFTPTYNNLALAYEGGGHRDEAVAAWGQVLGHALRVGDERRRERAERHLAAIGSRSKPPTEDEAEP